MDQKTTDEKWILLENYTIFYGGIWLRQDPSNSLSELIEVPGLVYLGVENDRHMYMCEQPPKDILDLVKENLGEDTHVYLSIHIDDEDGQKVYLWRY